ncbi:hypothetical protein XELAEV_18000221mg [Xenopus laevis]|uniref:RNA helicase n=1 Tax=Xenopus laevis TaxID=8355 RepID=A0A974BQG1_XENLA|nr:hypothetical protein XELAEV_18000221mg [Xenopus laevis]
MPGKVYTDEMEGKSIKKKKLTETPLPKLKKRKMQNGETEDLDLEHVTESVNGEINNNNPTPKLKKNKKPAPKSDLSETAEQCDGEQPDPSTPTPKKVKKKKKEGKEDSDAQEETNISLSSQGDQCDGEQPDPSTPTPKKIKKKKLKEGKEDSDAQEETDISEPQMNGVKSVKKSKKNTTGDEPAPKKRKTDTSEITAANECEEKELTKEEEEIKKEKIDGDFSKFPISKDTIKNLQAKGVTYLFPIQSKTFHTVYSGKDVVVQARTGTGKTFSFGIPLVERLSEDQQPLARGRAPRVIILTPTRELAIQITNELRSMTKKLKVACFYGGTPYQQQDPEENPQTLLFSATCPDWMYNVAKKYMRKQYEKVDLVGHRSQKAAITVEHLAIECNRSQKAAVLGDIVQVYSGSHGKTIIFCDSKLQAHELSTNCGSLKQSAKPLHGDLQQKEREVVLKGFRQGTFEVLIATNVAARGLDIPEVDLVVLYSAPKEADAYVHRSGRTGRAGRTGVCISLYEPWEKHYLRNVERSTGITFKRVGIPSLMNVAKSSSADAIKSLDTVPADVIEHFKEYAQELIEKKGALTALAAALAHISGATSIKQRSLLNMEAGYMTITLKSSVPIHNLSYAWRSIKEQLGEDVDSKIHRMCLLKDSMGVCFDVRSEDLQSMQESWSDTRRWQFTITTELPEIQESERSFDGPRNRSFGGRGRRPFDRRNNSRNSSGGGGGRRGRSGGFRRGR